LPNPSLHPLPLLRCYNAPWAPTAPSRQRYAITAAVWAGPGSARPLEQARGTAEGWALGPAVVRDLRRYHLLWNPPRWAPHTATAPSEKMASKMEPCRASSSFSGELCVRSHVRPWSHRVGAPAPSWLTDVSTSTIGLHSKGPKIRFDAYPFTC
jgi:hypothetical protein